MKHPNAVQIRRDLRKVNPRVASAPARLVIHTTETASGSAKRLAEKHRNPPQLWADPKTEELYQVLPLDKVARALRHPSGTPETNHMGHCVQLEIIGRAATSHTWPDSWLKWLAKDVIKPACELMSISLDFLQTHGEGEGIVLASTSSPIRMSWDEWRAFGGICGHQHVPGNDHWDPGRLDVARIIEHLGRAAPIKDSLGDPGVPRATNSSSSMHLVLDGDVAWVLSTNSEGVVVRNKVPDASALSALSVVLGEPVRVPDGSLSSIAAVG